MSFEGRVAAVTGGGAGIGEAICHRLAADGAKLAVLDLSLDTAQRTVGGIGGAIALQVDVADSGAVDLAVGRSSANWARSRSLSTTRGRSGSNTSGGSRRCSSDSAQEIAASGCAQTPLEALARLTDEEWRSLLAVHLDGTFHGTRAAARAMASRGVGVIVNMASICGLEGCTGHPHYSAAKAGILGFTRSVAKELIVQGIRVNAVAPGFVDTRRLKGSLGAGRQAELARTPLGRLGTPEEIAAAVAFLAADDAAYFVGATLSPNGGLLTT